MEQCLSERNPGPPATTQSPGAPRPSLTESKPPWGPGQLHMQQVARLTLDGHSPAPDHSNVPILSCPLPQASAPRGALGGARTPASPCCVTGSPQPPRGQHSSGPRKTQFCPPREQQASGRTPCSWASCEGSLFLFYLSCWALRAGRVAGSSE